MVRFWYGESMAGGCVTPTTSKGVVQATLSHSIVMQYGVVDQEIPLISCLLTHICVYALVKRPLGRVSGGQWLALTRESCRWVLEVHEMLNNLLVFCH